jgi:hypothetical protein
VLGTRSSSHQAQPSSLQETLSWVQWCKLYPYRIFLQKTRIFLQTLNPNKNPKTQNPKPLTLNFKTKNKCLEKNPDFWVQVEGVDGAASPAKKPRYSQTLNNDSVAPCASSAAPGPAAPAAGDEGCKDAAHKVSSGPFSPHY